MILNYLMNEDGIDGVVEKVLLTLVAIIIVGIVISWILSSLKKQSEAGKSGVFGVE